MLTRLVEDSKVSVKKTWFESLLNVALYVMDVLKVSFVRSQRYAHLSSNKNSAKEKTFEYLLNVSLYLYVMDILKLRCFLYFVNVYIKNSLVDNFFVNVRNTRG